MVKLFENSGDPDQKPCSAASGLGLHCLPVALLGISRLQWVKIPNQGFQRNSASINGAVTMGTHNVCVGEKLTKLF